MLVKTYAQVHQGTQGVQRSMQFEAFNGLMWLFCFLVDGVLLYKSCRLGFVDVVVVGVGTVDGVLSS